jgi:hypothetical protein
LQSSDIRENFQYYCHAIPALYYFLGDDSCVRGGAFSNVCTLIGEDIVGVVFHSSPVVLTEKTAASAVFFH